MREVDRNSDEGHELHDQYSERIWIYDFPEGSGRYVAGTGVPPAEPDEFMLARARDNMEDAMLAYEEEVESFHEWAERVYEVNIVS